MPIKPTTNPNQQMKTNNHCRTGHFAAVTGASMFTNLCAVWWLLMAAFLLTAPPAFAEKEKEAKPSLKTMTVNLYLGSGTERILTLDPTDPNYLMNLLSAVTGVYYESLASQPQIRLQGVAKEVAARLPDILAVQEASLIRNQSPGDLVIGGASPATNVVFDYLQLLVGALAAQGAHYAVVSTANEIDVELPMFNLQTGLIDDVRLTDREAILARTDLPPGHLRVRNPQSGHFTSVLQIPSVGLSVLRGWCSVDASVRGESFRFICTHLEEETSPQIQLNQAQELLSGPAHINLPVILAGDFNADTLHRNGTQTYDSFLAAGFKDSWVALNRNNLAGGLTWGHDEFLADPTQPLAWRIDLVLYRGGDFLPVDAEALDLTLDRTQPPLWASDHAAVATQFRFHDDRNEKRTKDNTEHSK